MPLDDHAITGMMLRFGGSFVRTLGALYRMGDDENKQRLKNAFPEYWARYARMAERGERSYATDQDRSQ